MTLFHEVVNVLLTLKVLLIAFYEFIFHFVDLCINIFLFFFCFLVDQAVNKLFLSQFIYVNEIKYAHTPIHT